MAYKPNFPNLNIPETPGLTEEERQRVLFAASNQPGGGFISAGNRQMLVTPTGTATNFPTSRDVVNQSAQQALNIGAAARPPAPVNPFLAPGGTSIAAYQDSVAVRKQQTEEQLLAWKDPNKFKVDWVNELPVVRAMTPQEQTQKWADTNVAAKAEIVPPGGKSMVAPEYKVLDKSHVDSSIFASGTADKPTATAYKRMTTGPDGIAKKLDVAKAGWRRPETKEDIQELVNSLGIDDRVGAFVDDYVSKWVRQANPELSRQIIGEKKAGRDNDASYVRWVAQQATVSGGARLSATDILAARTPESEKAWRDSDADEFIYDRVSGESVLVPPTPEQEAEKKQKGITAASMFAERQIDEQIAKNPDLMKTYNDKGEATVVRRIDYEKEQRKIALDEAKQERDREASDIKALQEGRAAKRAELELTPQHREWVAKEKDKAAFKEKRLLLLENKHAKNQSLENENKIDTGEADKIYAADLDKLEKDKRYMPAPEPGAETGAVEQPVANEPIAENAAGQQAVFRNGKWILVQPTKPTITPQELVNKQ